MVRQRERSLIVRASLSYCKLCVPCGISDQSCHNNVIVMSVTIYFMYFVLP